uniref:Uncharacterized protein n=1 Tax=Anguilla anguilla TaxID=7936 RepID=A0A0E9XMC2_ANGAN
MTGGKQRGCTSVPKISPHYRRSSATHSWSETYGSWYIYSLIQNVAHLSIGVAATFVFSQVLKVGVMKGELSWPNVEPTLEHKSVRRSVQ